MGMWIYILIVLYFSGLNNFLYCFKKVLLVYKGGLRLFIFIIIFCNLVRKVYILFIFI